MKAMVRNEIWCFAEKHRRWYDSANTKWHSLCWWVRKISGHNHSSLHGCFCSLLLCGQKIIIKKKVNWKGKCGGRAVREQGWWERGTALCPTLLEVAEAPGVTHMGQSKRLLVCAALRCAKRWGEKDSWTIRKAAFQCDLKTTTLLAYGGCLFNFL